MRNKTWTMAQRTYDSDEELQEAPTKRPRLDCASNSISRKFSGASTFTRANSRKAGRRSGHV